MNDDWTLTEFRKICEDMAPFESSPDWRRARQIDRERGPDRAISFIPGLIEEFYYDED